MGEVMLYFVPCICFLMNIVHVCISLHKLVKFLSLTECSYQLEYTQWVTINNIFPE